jgi:hypothetical protein
MTLFELIFGFIYLFFVVFSWNRAKAAFEADDNVTGYWNIFLSAFAGAALGNLLL